MHTRWPRLQLFGPRQILRLFGFYYRDQVPNSKVSHLSSGLLPLLSLLLLRKLYVVSTFSVAHWEQY